MLQPIWATLITSGTGAIAWLAVSMLGGRSEAWDSPLYFTIAMPALAIVIAAVAFFAPARFWRWAMFPFWAPALVAFLQNPTANLLPLGLIAFSILGAVYLVPAAIAAQVGRRFSS